MVFTMAFLLMIKMTDTLEFVDKVHSLTVPNVLVSLDVINMFTNIPLELVIVIITAQLQL